MGQLHFSRHWVKGAQKSAGRGVARPGRMLGVSRQGMVPRWEIASGLLASFRETH